MNLIDRAAAHLLRDAPISDHVRIVTEAFAEPSNHPIIRRYCLTSGGSDSTVLAHACSDFYDSLIHIDTGTALPGVREFVENFAAKVVEKPLVICEAGESYRNLVLGTDEWWQIYYRHRLVGEGPDAFRDRVSKLSTREQRMALLLPQAPLGFPGPAGHRYAYQRLKERQLERLMRDTKQLYGTGGRAQRIVLLSGVRMDESDRRRMTGTAQGEWERRGNQLWINPLQNWSNVAMARYRHNHNLPVSDVTAIIHRSGECNCLAFAAKGEREDIIGWFPDWYAQNIRPIEDAARERGLIHWQWGWGAGQLLTERPGAAGPLCSACKLAQESIMAGT